MEDEPKPPEPTAKTATQAEKLFPFVLRSRKLVVGRDNLFRNKSKLQFLLITTDISENSREEMLQKFGDKPIVQVYTAPELEKFFQVYNTKVIGFVKSPLATTIYQGLREHRLNRGQPLA